MPSAKIGGDGFGDGWLDRRRFAMWLLDVSGHGAGSALLAASAMNVLRAQSLPGVEFGNPAAVLAAVNARCQMDSHGGLYFSNFRARGGRHALRKCSSRSSTSCGASSAR